MKTVSESQPPEMPQLGGAYWERSEDPFHVEAFSGVNLPSNAIIIGGKITEGPRKGGWMLIDWIENPIGFVADGEDAGSPDEYEITEGPHKRLCAYPVIKPAV
jgi:hypothetical protein